MVGASGIGREQLTSDHRNNDGGRLLERNAELGMIEAAVERARDGRGSTLVVVGPPGIGKSRLCAAAGDLAREHGMAVRKARGGTLERELPWATVRELLGAHDPDLFEGPAAYARPVLGGGDRPGTSDPEGATLHGLYWLCAGLAGQRPLMLLVDDAHWADPSSLRWLSYIGSRTEDLPVVLLVTGRTGDAGAPRPLEDMIARARRLEPRPLSVAGCHELLVARLGQPVDRELAEACHRASGGNPFLLTELAAELAEQEGSNGVPAASAVDKLRPNEIARAIRARVSTGGPAHRLAEAVAVLASDVSMADARKVARLPEEESERALTELIESGILDGGLPLRFVNPLVRDVLWENVGQARRALLHARAVAVLRARRAPAEQVAAHLLHTEPVGDERAVEDLRAAAGAAIAAGAPEPALEFLRRAVAEPPPSELETATVLELAEAEAMLGLPSALTRLEQATRTATGEAERAMIRRRLGERLFQAGKPAEARAAFEAALADLGTAAASPAAAELEILIDAMGVITGARDGRGRTDPPPANAPRELLVQRSLALISASVDGPQAAELARLAAGGGAMLDEHGPGLMFSIAGSCLIWCDLLDEASEEIDEAIRRAVAIGDLPGLALMRFGRSWVSYWTGRLPEALEDVDVAIRAWTDEGRLRGQLAYALYWKAITLTEMDELDAADQALEGIGELPPFYAAAVSAARARIAVARGAAAEARDELRAVRASADQSSFFASAAIVPWRADEALAARLDGDRREAMRSADEDLALAERFGIARQLGIALRTRGVVGDDPEALARSVEVLKPSPSRLELCRSLVELGAVLRRRGANARARDPLRRGLDLASRFGARALERRARDELHAAGARPRRHRLSGPEALTGAERRVAELAAQGLRNRDIAQQLFLTVRTIETHLTSVYRKLDIGSRAELAGALNGSAGAPLLKQERGAGH